ncbi:MAG: hypothetical protein WBV61_08870 [Rhodanobacteraceae bacterium]
MRRNALALPGAIMLFLLLPGCGFMHKHFGRDENGYQKSVQEKPLEVPPDLDSPNTSGALVIPPVGSAASPSISSGAPAATPSQPATSPTEISPAAAPPPISNGPGVALSGGGLSINDTVDSAYRRVGLALERGGDAKIVGRDEASHSYSVESTGKAKSNAGWLKRMITLGRAGKTAVGVHLTVRVSAEGSGSRVSIQGGGDEASEDAAKALLNMLRARLG